MQRLTAYCRKTVLTSASEGAYPAKRRTAASTKAAFQDAMHGTDTGWWSDLIYTVDVIRLANYYRSDIAAAVRDYLSETGEIAGAYCGGEYVDFKFTWGDIIASTARRVTMSDYAGDNGTQRALDADALTWGLRFAVEYITGNLASQYAPDL